MSEGKARGVGRRRWVVAFGIALGAAMALAVGCALDDTAITALGSEGGVGGDSSILDSGGGGGDANDGAPACVPKSCASYPSDCHPSLDDGCGKTIDCSGACPDAQACIPDGGPAATAAFFCNGPPVCVDAGEPGGNCGTLTNPGNATLTTNCGSCATTGFTCASNTCGCNGGTTCTGGNLCCITASGTPNCNDSNSACCLRKACADDRTQCSTAFSNGCGGNLDCTTNCIGGKVCDTSNSTCCTEQSLAAACGTVCNMGVQDNCHKTVTCPDCSSGTCDNTHHCCANNVCNGVCCLASESECMGTNCCAPEALSVTCNGLCGSSNDNCGVSKNCGSCTDGETCAGSANCTCGSVMCTPGQKCHSGPDHCS